MSAALACYLIVTALLFLAGVFGVFLFRRQVTPPGERLILIAMVFCSAVAWPFTVPISFAITISDI